MISSEVVIREIAFFSHLVNYMHYCNEKTKKKVASLSPVKILRIYKPKIEFWEIVTYVCFKAEGGKVVNMQRVLHNTSTVKGNASIIIFNC